MEANPWEILEKRKYPLLLFAIGVIVFFNSFFGGFVWDDKIFFQNSALLNIHNILSFFSRNQISVSGYYRPLFIFYLASIFNLFHTQTFFYHIIQTSLHIANTLFVFVLLGHFFQKRLAFFLSLIFLIHPMQVEPVVYIAVSDNPLFFFFGAAALVLTIKYKQSFRTIVGIGILFFLSLLTKELGIFFILLSLTYAYFFDKKKLGKIVIASSLSFFLYLFFRVFLGGMFVSKVGDSAIARLSFGERLQMIPHVFLYYLKTFVFPSTLVIDQQWVIYPVTFTSFILPLVGCLLVFGCVLAYYVKVIRLKKEKERNAFLFFTLWFLLCSSILLQIFPLDMTVADRWFYLPMVGLLGMLGVFWNVGKTYIPSHAKPMVFAAFVFFLCLLASRTIVRNGNWIDAQTLYAHDEPLTQSFDLENNLATELSATGNINGAILHEKKAVMLLPNEINTNNLAKLYEEQEDYVQAKNYYLQSIRLIENAPSIQHHPNNYVFYAEFLAIHGDPKEAILFISSSLKQYPKLAELWMYLAISHYRLHEYASAEKDIHTAVMLYPSQQVLYIENQINHKLPIVVINPYTKKTIQLP